MHAADRLAVALLLAIVVSAVVLGGARGADAGARVLPWPLLAEGTYAAVRAAHGGTRADPVTPGVLAQARVGVVGFFVAVPARYPEREPL